MEKTFNYVLALQNKLTDTQKARLDKIATGLAATGAFAALGAASAQTSNGTGGIDMSAPIGAFGTAMSNTITNNAPELFGILALSVGFFFIWGRVRALF